MAWEVRFHTDFALDYAEFPIPLQEAIADKIELLREHGPSLGRPHADTLRDSRHSNMKEMRIDKWGDFWRIAFAFDPRRQAILLLAWNKRGENERLFYRSFIREADTRFDEHLRGLGR